MPLTLKNIYFESNTYVYPFGADGACVIVDPGLDTDGLNVLLKKRCLEPIAVFCTHGHFDHIGGAAVIQKKYGIPVYMHSADMRLAGMSKFMMAAFKIDRRIELPEFSCLEDIHNEIECAGLRVTIHSVPGHTPGSIAIEIDRRLFSGDSLFSRSLKLSRLPGEDQEMLRASLMRLINITPSDVTVYPGHGDYSMMGDILVNNSQLARFLAAAG